MAHKFGLWTLIALVVGNAIGAGIYTTSGFSLAALGSREWVLLAWLVAGLIALCGALSYGMLVQGIQESGGEYLYLSRSIHPLAGFIAGWISLLAGFPGAIAFAATALETYLRSATTTLQGLPTDTIAVVAVVAAGIIHSIRVKTGAQIHQWVTAIMLCALGLVIVLSAYQFAGSAELPVVDPAPLAAFSGLAFANSLVWISLSYSGFNAAAYVAGEARNPRVTVPRGMVIGTLITMLLCLLLNAIMLYSVSPDVLRGRAEIAALSAHALGGSTAKNVIELVIAASLLTSITAMAMAGPRVYAKMAEDGALPAMFKTRAGQPPRASIMLQVVVSLALILIADLRLLMSYLGLTLSLCLALAVSSLFVRHRRLGERPTSRWYPFAPICFVGGTVLFAVLTAVNDYAQVLAIVPTIAAGCIAYLVARRSRATLEPEQGISS